LRELVAPEPLAEPFHQELVDLLRKYFFTGGMPEAVSCYVETANLTDVRSVQKEIVDAYALDFAKHAPAADIPKLSHIWESVATQLARENKKFMFSAIRKSARAREYENAVQWLEDAGLILRAFCAKAGKVPLKGYRDPGVFKVYALDVGLLGAMAGLPPKQIVAGIQPFEAYAGALTENYAAQQLTAALGTNLSYWKSSGGRAEVDFLLELDGSVVPLEVKAGVNPKSRSLRSYDQQFHPPFVLRTTLLNLRKQERICNIPLYALPNISRIWQLLNTR
jgi:predicted AAA+ superfamily ATPase